MVIKKKNQNPHFYQKSFTVRWRFPLLKSQTHTYTHIHNTHTQMKQKKSVFFFMVCVCWFFPINNVIFGLWLQRKRERGMLCCTSGMNIISHTFFFLLNLEKKEEKKFLSFKKKTCPSSSSTVKPRAPRCRTFPGTKQACLSGTHTHSP